MTKGKPKQFQASLAAASPELADWVDLMDVVVKPEVRDRILTRLVGVDGNVLEERASEVILEVAREFEDGMAPDQAKLLAIDIVSAAVRRLRKMGFQVGTA